MYLIMIWKWDDRSTDAEDHRRMDLAVGVRTAVAALLQQLIQRHWQHHRLFLHCVDVFNNPIRHKILPAAQRQTNLQNY